MKNFFQRSNLVSQSNIITVTNDSSILDSTIACIDCSNYRDIINTLNSIISEKDKTITRLIEELSLANFKLISISSNSVVISPKVDVISRKDSTTASIVTSEPKVLLLTDSHGRIWSEYLVDLMVPNVSVFGKVMPGAGIFNVVSGIADAVVDFGKRDHVVIMAGTNDSNFDYAIHDALEFGKLIPDPY